jgi:phosphomannomutase
LAAWLKQLGYDVREVSETAPAMNDGCGAGELSPGQSWTWDEIASSGHLLIESLSSNAIGSIVGAALDGDGDRCLLVRETTVGVEVVDGDDMADAVLRACPKDWKVAASIESNLKLLSTIEAHPSMQGFETAVGDRWLSHALIPHLPIQDHQPLLFGIEDSGHIVLPSPHPKKPEHWSLVGDGAMTLLLALLGFENAGEDAMQKGWKKRLSVKNPNRWMWDGRNELSDAIESMVRTHLELAGSVAEWERMGLEGESNLMLLRCQFNGMDASFGLRNSGTQEKTSISLRFSESEPGFDAMLLMRSVQNLLLRTFNPVAY